MTSLAAKEGHQYRNQIHTGCIPHWRLVCNPGLCTQVVQSHHFEGHGTEDSPYVAGWLDSDPRNPYNWSLSRRALITCCISASSLAASLSSSAYTGAAMEVEQQFNADTEVVTLGLSLFVLGFGVGPVLFAPLSELYGRQLVFISTYGTLAIFNAGAADPKDIQTLLVLRFFAGVAGSSPLTNIGAQIADMYGPRLVGLAMSTFIVAPFIGPALGPIIGGYIGKNVGWRWVEGFLALFTGAMWLLGTLFIPVCSSAREPKPLPKPPNPAGSTPANSISRKTAAFLSRRFSASISTGHGSFFSWNLSSSYSRYTWASSTVLSICSSAPSPLSIKNSDTGPKALAVLLL